LHEVPGHGVEGLVEGKRVRLGRRSWVAPSCRSIGRQANAQGVAFAIEGRGLWFTTLSERVRPGARDMIAALRARNIPVTLLSGDGRCPGFGHRP
jgi:Cu2+-exporting ATPase